jgi:hypothetical protein
MNKFEVLYNNILQENRNLSFYDKTLKLIAESADEEAQRILMVLTDFSKAGRDESNKAKETSNLRNKEVDLSNLKTLREDLKQFLIKNDRRFSVKVKYNKNNPKAVEDELDKYILSKTVDTRTGPLAGLKYLHSRFLSTI